MAVIGKRNLLSIIREAPPGLYLDGGELGEILLPGRYIPKGLVANDKLDVFVYRDSEDRLVATTEVPLAMVGDFANLRVISVNRQVGAFLDWGLSKDLLLPFREQAYPVRAGQRTLVYVYLDSITNRIVATTRLNRHLSRETPSYRDGQAVNLLVVRKTPLGYEAIVEGAHRGLLYHDNLAVPLEPGQSLKGFVRTVRPGGKIDLSLDASGYQRVAPLTDKIVEALEANSGQLDVDDDTSPEAIRASFGVSKKAFKQALGKLYKARRIRFKKPGIELLDNSAWQPESPAKPKKKS
jgi:predicted RNA-binding protein (virulence factor B family)